MTLPMADIPIQSPVARVMLIVWNVVSPEL